MVREANEKAFYSEKALAESNMKVSPRQQLSKKAFLRSEVHVDFWFSNIDKRSSNYL